VPARTGLELDLTLTSRCVACQAERPAEGKRILSTRDERGTTFIVQSETPCEHCGERRIRVEFRVEG
jgi:hypothetical protein